ncbi:MAG: hypothetical protein U9N61_11530 [Euryarchaeota archaeon]|nr:hypothetical protein [Euryarchaeota archaeon]
MATLGNGLDTLDFGTMDWVTPFNGNLTSVLSASAVIALFSDNALAEHNHDYELSSTTIDSAWLQEHLGAVNTDIRFTNDTEGIVVVDTTTTDTTRIYVDNGVLSTEVVI